MRRKRKVALAGYYGFDNLGDELLLASAVKQLENLGVSRDELAVLTASPKSDFYMKLGAECINRWDPIKVSQVLKRSETLLFGGGGLFQDVTSVRSCLYYWGITQIACMAGTIPWAVGQSIGPFNNDLSKAISRNALSKCKVLEVRDDISRQAAENLGLNAEVGDDLVFTLTPGVSYNGSALLVNFRPWKNIEKFICSVRDYVESQTLDCIGVAMSPEDLSLMRKIDSSLSVRFKDIVLVKTWDEACKIWSSAGCAVGMRLHFSLISLLFGLKQMLFAYDPKVSSFAERWKIPLWENCVIDPKESSVALGDVRNRVMGNFEKYAKRVMNL